MTAAGIPPILLSLMPALIAASLNPLATRQSITLSTPSNFRRAAAILNVTARVVSSNLASSFTSPSSLSTGPDKVSTSSESSSLSGAPISSGIVTVGPATASTSPGKTSSSFELSLGAGNIQCSTSSLFISSPSDTDCFVTTAQTSRRYPDVVPAFTYCLYT